MLSLGFLGLEEYALAFFNALDQIYKVEEGKIGGTTYSEGGLACPREPVISKDLVEDVTLLFCILVLERGKDFDDGTFLIEAWGDSSVMAFGVARPWNYG
jgi:hypothetical protein